MLHITFSNRLEPLVERLLTRLAHAPASPFSTENIIIPSAAMRRKVDMAITDHFGICAQVRFSFLADWLWQALRQSLPLEPVARFAPEPLAWRIFSLFGDAAFVAAHARLAAYLAKADAVMRFDLATRTATLFEQYMTYRPEWVAQWSEGHLAKLATTATDQHDDQAWQAALWQRLLHDGGTAQPHLAPALLQALTHALATAPMLEDKPVIHVFCLPTTAPIHLAALRALGQTAQIYLYLLNPCQEYWFDVVDQKRLSYLALQGDMQHHEVGHRLLAAWGKQTQAQLALLFETDATAHLDDAGFTPHTGTHLLGALQNSVLYLQELAPASIDLAATDRSIEVHCCHSLTRELEVLQDQLLALFAGPQAPLPSDVLVVMPKLDDAAPLIDTVFGSVPLNRRIPYRITGRAASQSNAAARALLGLMALATSRITASELFGLLQQGIIGRRFGFDNAALDVVHGWMAQSGIRWGLDAAHRAATDLPATAHCTFDDGLQRLFLGYALPAIVDEPFGARIPAANVEGSEAVILGRFWHCLEVVREWQHDLGQARLASEWPAFLSNLVDTALAPDREQLDEVAQVRDSLRELHAQLAQANIDGPVPESVVRTALTALLDASAQGGVPQGSVTFAGLASLRNLPYRVICAIGLNDGDFPSAARAMEFDLMASHPRAGDRQRGQDERNLFLDLILAARDRLYLSYTGRGIRDNATMPPSVLVADLLDYLVPAISTKAQDSQAHATARARLLVQHPLQPFALAYFIETGDARLASANDEYCGALQHALRTPREDLATMANGGQDDDDADDGDGDGARPVGHAFFAAPLAAPPAQWRTVTSEQLKSFFNNPSRFLLQQRLGLRLQSDDDTLQDDEPFLPDWAGKKALATRLLPLFARGLNDSAIRTMASAGTELPSGPIGDEALDTMLTALRAFFTALADASTQACLPPHQASLSFTLDGETWQLNGDFSDLRQNGLVRARFDETRASDYLAGWIDHLLLNAALPPEVTGVTQWIFQDGQYQLQPCEHAHKLLADLLRLYREGLSRPIHFFPKSAWTYMTSGQAIGKARSTWCSSRFHPYGEDRDASYQLALRGITNPLDDEFERMAKTVFAPLLDHLIDGRISL